MCGLNEIDLTYPENLNDWIKLIESVETISEFRVLCGFSNIKELLPIATELMTNGPIVGMKESTDIYLNKIATKCIEDESIGKRLYLYFLNGIKEYNLPTINGDLDQIFKNFSLKELSNVYKTSFESYVKNSQNDFIDELKKDKDAYNKMQTSINYLKDCSENLDIEEISKEIEKIFTNEER